MSRTGKIQVTKNYRMFTRSQDNRPVDPRRHKKLFDSMKLYGFLSCFPIVCFRDASGNLIVKDGQHRLGFAESLGLSVYWVEESVDFDIAVINCTSKVWSLRDYAQKFVANGKSDYQDGIDFAEQYGLPLGTAFALLGGTTSFGNMQEQFVAGAFRVKDRKWADAVAGIYGPLSTMAPAVRNARFIEACMAVCRVKCFDPARLLHSAERCRDKLVSYSTRDAYLDMIESIYNFGRVKLVALKVEALIAMKDRNAAKKSSKKKAAV